MKGDKIIPTKDFVVLELIKQETSLIIPQGIDPTKTGKGDFYVIDCGPECKEVKKGDRIVPMTNKIFQMEIDGMMTYFTQEALIALVIRKEIKEGGDK